jgi:hypothetical protein
VPGNGEKPCYIEDPQIIVQKWGANLRTNFIQLESELRGIDRPLTRDCVKYKAHQTSNSETIEYPSSHTLCTEQSRATNPAWWYRDLEQTDWGYPPLNPQENTCLPFNNNLNTRILEKDYFVAKNDCVEISDNYSLPVKYFTNTNNFHSTNCQQTNSCLYFPNTK